LRIIGLTVLTLISRPAALRRVHRLLLEIGAPADLARVALRSEPLQPGKPPGADAAAGGSVA
jgi:hypothetical protein